ncbi:MAG: hypothetical protein NZM16_02040 [Thermoflexus sp.]|uniref:hypothetical protein n=2 Tax=Thermoflexus sp. TaxID=1969742 RepID=UPI0025E91751|nr:hypothetical protein [Thermoflexus sp.]MCS6962813.1 hypothetical protein [Thermoflexus sp.]
MRKNRFAYDSRTTADGSPAPTSARLILNDDHWHTLIIAFRNRFGTGGTAWIDNVELIAPDGRQADLNGEFDPTSILSDTAHLTAALSQQIGGRAVTGPHKPVTRGEVAIGDDGDYQGDHVCSQTLDVQGMWLHHFVWGPINPGGLYELYWDPVNIRRHNLYYHFRAFRNFMDGVPLNNGRYEDTRAVASHPDLRVLGRVDRSAERGHLWVHNRHHPWWNAVNNVPIPPISGTISVGGLISGTYCVTWWDTWSGTIFLTQTVPTAVSTLTLALPAPLAIDVALQFARLSDRVHGVDPPVVCRGKR